jgi:hypothetical protein
MKKTVVFALITMISTVVSGQELEKELRPFSRVIASPRINLVLKKGSNESIRIVYDDVAASKINVLVKGKTLHIFLDRAKHVERPVRHGRYNNTHGMYEGVSVTAYVTYKDLDKLEIRGKQELTCHDALEADRFVLRAYGENEITLASLKTEYFKASLYGENELTINDGRVMEQKYRLFGENKIDTQEMKSAFTTTRIFGEGNLKINSSEEVIVNAFGEPHIHVDGGAYVNRRIILGHASIFKN